MYYTIYEISVFDILLQILIAIAAVGFCILILFTSAKKEYSIIARIVTTVFLSAVVVLIVSSQVGDSEIYVDYLNGNYKEVEGDVKQFSPGSDTQKTSESFYINGTYFEYYDGWEFGYTKYGEIKANDKLKVSYVYDTDYKTNRIVKISRYEKY